ncbi:MAG TPA: serine/threonine-protein kinase, partial [Thermoanaerobaculia bacterium]|nr:serine/threonine-protein kinase [Thermoanaerobaculia bacterium]
MSDQPADSEVERLLDAALAVPPAQRDSFLARNAGSDSALHERLVRLLALCDEREGFLERSPLAAQDADAPAAETLGTSIGPYRLVSRLGAGGMGDVYLAERVEGGFRQRVALKLARPFAGVSSARFEAERQILAGLEHPGIARLTDGGVTPDGRPYMAMEYVEGQDVRAFCDAHETPLEGRLELFGQICDAVSFAHAHLVVHRDLKPANIFVTGDGRVKLLDFGIAKILQPAGYGEATHTLHLSPTYAAPEQLTGGAITTATDVYALGVVLYELLAGRPPWQVGEMPLAAAVQKLMDAAPPPPSEAAAESGAVPAKRLRGDLDAIVGKALRMEPRARYADARALADDLARHGRSEPVEARAGARAYVLRRFLRRRWLPLSAAAAVFLALLAGIAGTTWQARRTTREAARANATKDFLLGIFRASDPRIAQDKPRGQVTAKELLDIGATRIEKEFRSEPDLQIELLGLTADIYSNLSEEERYKAVQKRRTELARARYGPRHPIVIEALLSDANAACAKQDYAKAAAILAETDTSLKQSAAEGGILRAAWWSVKARSLSGTARLGEERIRALDRAVAIYEKVAPKSGEFANTLNLVSVSLSERGQPVRAREVLKRAIAIHESAPVPNQARIGELRLNLARKEESLGLYESAEATYEKAETQIRRTVGEGDSMFWLARGYHARLLHMRGRRERAFALFEETLRMIPPDWKTNTSDQWFREIYAERLAAAGRARDAVLLLESVHRTYAARPQYDYDLREVRKELGDAYDGAGRPADARTMLKTSRDDYVAKEAPDSEWALKARERWGRFLLEHTRPGEADFRDAETELRDVLAKAARQPWAVTALAHGDLARLALARSDTAG